MGVQLQSTRRKVFAPVPRILIVLAIALNTWANGLFPDAATIARIREKFGEPAGERVKIWGDLMLQVRNLDEPSRLELVNRFFNGIPHMDDQLQWGVPDYWETPLELLAMNGGDCEDYALAKYFTLKSAGVPEERLRVTYAKAWLPKAKRMEPHMVLTYYATPDAEPLILDNLRTEIQPASRRTDLIPTMSFNADGLWAARQRGQNGRLGDTTSLGQWVAILERMN